MQQDRIIRKSELIPLLGISDPTIRRLEIAGNFPKRIQLGGKSVGWLESEINAWLEAKKESRPIHKVA